MLIYHRNLLMILSAAMLGLNALPILSAHCGGSESCTLMIRGYNLLEFSSWAVIPVFSPVLVLSILLSLQKKSTKNTELVILLAANTVCYVESLRAARTWLDGVSSGLINCHPGMLSFPIGTFAIVFYAMLYLNDFKMFKNINR